MDEIEIKYNIMDKVRVKIHYQNDSRTEVKQLFEELI